MCRHPWLFAAAAVLMLLAAGCTAVVAPPSQGAAGTGGAEPLTVRVNLNAQPFIERGYPTFGSAQGDRWKINQ